jgi:hypothetical protein
LVPGVVFPMVLAGDCGLPTEGEAGGCGVVVVVAGLEVAGAAAPVPDPVVCATAEPIARVLMPAIARGVNHR